MRFAVPAAAGSQRNILYVPKGSQTIASARALHDGATPARTVLAKDCCLHRWRNLERRTNRSTYSITRNSNSLYKLQHCTAPVPPRALLEAHRIPCSGNAHAHGYACKQHSPQNSQPTVAPQTQSRMADSSFAAHRRGDAAAPCSSAPSRRPLAAGSHRGADPTPHVLYCGLAPERHAIRSLCLRVSRLRSLTPC